MKVTDSVGGTSAVTAAAGLVIYSDPVALAPVASPDRVSTGEPFTITVNISGGVPNNESVQWQGLPGGCGPSPGELIELTVDCKTDFPGTYLVFVTVTDGDHFQSNSPRAQVVVTGNPITNQTTGPPPPMILGVPVLEFEAGVGVAVLLIVVLVAWAALRGRPTPAVRGRIRSPSGGGTPVWGGTGTDPTRRGTRAGRRIPDAAAPESEDPASEW